MKRQIPTAWGFKSLRYAKLLTSDSRGQEARRAFYRRPREKLPLSLRKNTRHFHILGSFLKFILTIKIIMKFEKNYGNLITLLNPLWELLDRLAQSIGWVVGGHLDLKHVNSLLKSCFKTYRAPLKLF